MAATADHAEWSDAASAHPARAGRGQQRHGHRQTPAHQPVRPCTSGTGATPPRGSADWWIARGRGDRPSSSGGPSRRILLLTTERVPMEATHWSTRLMARYAGGHIMWQVRSGLAGRRRQAPSAQDSSSSVADPHVADEGPSTSVGRPEVVDDWRLAAKTPCDLDSTPAGPASPAGPRAGCTTSPLSTWTRQRCRACQLRRSSWTHHRSDGLVDGCIAGEPVRL